MMVIPNTDWIPHTEWSHPIMAITVVNALGVVAIAIVATAFLVKLLSMLIPSKKPLLVLTGVCGLGFFGYCGYHILFWASFYNNGGDPEDALQMRNIRSNVDAIYTRHQERMDVIRFCCIGIGIGLGCVTGYCCCIAPWKPFQNLDAKDETTPLLENPPDERVVDTPWPGGTTAGGTIAPPAAGGMIAPPSAGGMIAPPGAGGMIAPPGAGGMIAPPEG